MTGQTLLLTATITPPPNARALVRVDPELRLLDYLWALEYYLKLPDEVIRRVVFVENSASDLGRLREVAGRYPGKEVEFVSFFGLDYPPEYGRGFGEFKLLDHAIENSSTLAKLGPEDHVWKGTGRLRLLNFATMIRSAPAHYDIYCDLRNWPMPWMELRFFSFTVEGYRRHLMGIYQDVREDLKFGAAEWIMRQVITAKIGDPAIVPRFRRQPLVEGIQGSYNTNYAHGYKNKAKHAFRVAMRRVMPRVWV